MTNDELLADLDAETERSLRALRGAARVLPPQPTRASVYTNKKNVTRVTVTFDVRRLGASASMPDELLAEIRRATRDAARQAVDAWTAGLTAVEGLVGLPPPTGREDGR